MATVHLSLQIQPHVAPDRFYEIIDAVIDGIRDTGLPHIVGPMGTTIEGELEEVLEVVRQAHHRCVELGADRVGAVVKIDYKPLGLTFDEKLKRYRKGTSNAAG